METRAVIDVGTNSIKLVVARPTRSGKLETVLFRRSTARLGAGLARRGRIGRREIDAACEAVDRFGALARRTGANDITAVGTWAFRAAKNGRSVAREISRRTGIELAVLSPREEAIFAWRSASIHVTRRHSHNVIADFGGGSLELVQVRRGRVESARSLSLGALRLTEMFLTDDPVDAAQLARLSRHARRSISRALPPDGLGEPSRTNLIASGGTVSTIARLLAPRGTIRLHDLRRLCDELSAIPLSRRRRFPGLPSDRADIIVAGIAVAIELMTHTRKHAMGINPGGVREGILLSQLFD